MDVKEAMAFQYKSHFILCMPMLAAEFRKQGIKARAVWMYVDHVGCGVAFTKLPLVDFLRISRKDLF